MRYHVSPVCHQLRVPPPVLPSRCCCSRPLHDTAAFAANVVPLPVVQTVRHVSMPADVAGRLKDCEAVSNRTFTAPASNGPPPWINRHGLVFVGTRPYKARALYSQTQAMICTVHSVSLLQSTRRRDQRPLAHHHVRVVLRPPGSFTNPTNLFAMRWFIRFVAPILLAETAPSLAPTRPTAAKYSTTTTPIPADSSDLWTGQQEVEVASMGDVTSRGSPFCNGFELTVVGKCRLHELLGVPPYDTTTSPNDHGSGARGDRKGYSATWGRQGGLAQRPAAGYHGGGPEDWPADDGMDETLDGWSEASVAYASRCIRWVGEQSNVSHFLGQARVSIAPIVAGTGLNTKVLQTIQAGTPVVTTPIGAQVRAITPGSGHSTDTWVS